MGMYTELILGAELKRETPIEVIERINAYISGDTEDTSPLIGASCYFAVNNSHCNFYLDHISNTWRISSRSNIRNYKGEIQSFLEWLKPYILSGSGNREFYAIVTYEECDEPTIYYLHPPTL